MSRTYCVYSAIKEPSPRSSVQFFDNYVDACEHASGIQAINGLGAASVSALPTFTLKQNEVSALSEGLRRIISGESDASAIRFLKALQEQADHWLAMRKDEGGDADMLPCTLDLCNR